MVLETGKTKGREKTQNEMMEKGEPLAACIDVESLSEGEEREGEQEVVRRCEEGKKKEAGRRR